MKIFIIDDLSMVSSDLRTDLDSRLGEIFMMIPEKESTSQLVMTVVNFLQVLPFRRKIV